MPFELIKSETLLQGRVFKIRRDHLKTPEGRETKLEIIEHGGSVVIVPIDQDGNVIFVRQYRHATGQDILELPAGTRDDGEPHEECAAREAGRSDSEPSSIEIANRRSISLSGA